MTITGTSGTSGSLSASAAVDLFVAPGTLISPPPGAILTGGSTVFTWNQAPGASQYTLTITANGVTIFSQSFNPVPNSATQSEVVTLPTDGLYTINASLTTLVNGISSPPSTASYALNPQAPETIPQLVSGQQSLQIPEDNLPHSQTLSFQAGTGDPREIYACYTADPTMRVRIVGATATSLTLSYTATALSTGGSVSCMCPGGGVGPPGPPIPPPVPVPAPVITSVIENTPVYPGAPGTITINGSHFGTIQGAVNFCLAGANPCVLPPSASGTSYSFVEWNDQQIQVTITFPSNTPTGLWAVFVTSIAWITGAAAANPSLGYFNVTQLDAALNPPKTVIGVGASGTPTASVDISPASGQYSWQIVATQPGDDTTAVQLQSNPPNCVNQTGCTVSFTGAKGGKATLQVTFTPTEGQAVTATARIIVVQINQITATVASDVGGGSQTACYTSGTPGVSCSNQLTSLGSGGLQWPASLWIAPYPLVLLSGSAPNGVTFSATTTPASNDGDVIGFLQFGIQRDSSANGDAAAIAQLSNSLPTLTPGASGQATLNTNLTTNSAGSFQVFAYVDTNQDGM